MNIASLNIHLAHPNIKTRISLAKLVFLIIAVAGVHLSQVGAQSPSPMRSSGDNIAPAYEGWEKNPDGSFNLVFGYMNRNWDEMITLPVGPNNNIEPGGPDQGQPTHFLPRRNFFVFRIHIPSNFGNQELVWTLTSHNKTERAYATLRPGYLLNNDAMTATLGAVGPGVTTAEVSASNRRPHLELKGDSVRTALVGQPITFIANAWDDGLPKPVVAPPWYGSPFDSALGTLRSSAGLRVAWFVYRGKGTAVTFDPPQFKVFVDVRGGSPWSPGWSAPPIPTDNLWITRAIFSEPGMYVVRCLAHDGGLSIYQDITVNVQ